MRINTNNAKYDHDTDSIILETGDRVRMVHRPEKSHRYYDDMYLRYDLYVNDELVDDLESLADVAKIHNSLVD